MEGISRRELARRHDISESTVRRHVESGALKDALLADGTLHPRKAGEALRRVLSSGKVVPKDLADARQRRLVAQVRKVGDEVAGLRRTSVLPSAVTGLVDDALKRIAGHLRAIPLRARDLAGRAADDVQRALRDLAFNALEAISSDPLPEHPWWNEPVDPPLIDIASLSPNALTARRIDLVAQKLEIQRARDRGELLDVDEEIEAIGVKLATIKTLLLAIPGRVAYAVAGADPDEAAAIVAAEVEELLADRGSREH